MQRLSLAPEAIWTCSSQLALVLLAPRPRLAIAKQDAADCGAPMALAVEAGETGRARVQAAQNKVKRLQQQLVRARTHSEEISN